MCDKNHTDNATDLKLFQGGGIFMALEDFEGVHVKPPNKSNTNFSGMETALLENGFTNGQIEEIIHTWEPDNSYRFLRGQLTQDSATWTFFNSFVFSFHICSTIGYGDVAPKTIQGQLTAILYAIVGIPINILFFKLLASSYQEAYARTTLLVEGDTEGRNSLLQKVLGHICFFVPWTFLLVFLPSTIFMFTDKWSFLEGVYFCFITLTTVGLGDYVSGEKLTKDTYYIIYKIAALFWMMYGLAFFLMVVDLLSSICTKFCLFNVEMKGWKPKLYSVGIDLERLDLHFRLFKSEGVEFKSGIWSKEKQTLHKKTHDIDHMRELASVAKQLQFLLSLEVEKKVSSTEESSRKQDEKVQEDLQRKTTKLSTALP